MATIKRVFDDKNFLELILNTATGFPGFENGEHPKATIGTQTGELTGLIIGYSISPKSKKHSATENNYYNAILYMNVDNGGQAVIQINKISYIHFATI